MKKEPPPEPFSSLGKDCLRKILDESGTPPLLALSLVAKGFKETISEEKIWWDKLNLCHINTNTQLHLKELNIHPKAFYFTIKGLHPAIQQMEWHRDQIIFIMTPAEFPPTLHDGPFCFAGMIGRWQCVKDHYKGPPPEHLYVRAMRQRLSLLVSWQTNYWKTENSPTKDNSTDLLFLEEFLKATKKKLFLYQGLLDHLEGAIWVTDDPKSQSAHLFFRQFRKELIKEYQGIYHDRTILKASL